MPDPDGLDVRVEEVAESPAFDRNGRPVSNTTVRYFVGAHGPFFLTYAPGEMSADRVNADIASKVQQLRAVVVRPA